MIRFIVKSFLFLDQSCAKCKKTYSKFNTARHYDSQEITRLIRVCISLHPHLLFYKLNDRVEILIIQKRKDGVSICHINHHF